MRLIADRKSPFTGQMSVMVEYDPHIGDKLMVCVDTGYMTYETLWKDSTELVEMMSQAMPSKIWDARRVEDGNIWCFTWIANPVVELFPEEVDGQMQWAVCPLKTVDEADPNVRRAIGIDVNGERILLHRALDEESRILYPFDDFSGAFGKCNEIKNSQMDQLDNEISELKQFHLNNIGESNE